MYREWRIAQDALYAAHHQRLLTALAAGLSIIEHGDRDRVWPITGPERPFIEPYNSDPAFLAAHLMGRHRGMGYDHTVGAVRYHLGAALGTSPAMDSDHD